MRKLLHLIALLLLGITPAAAAERVLLAAPDMGRSMATTTSATGSLTTLRQAAAKAGKLRVIVGLRVPFAAEMALAPAERARQRSEIASAAIAFRARYSAAVARNAAGVRSFSALPFMALEVTPQELDRLAADASVVSLVEDKKVTLDLATSTKLINAPEAWAQGYTGLGQTIAIIDSGIDKTHPFLAGKVVSEACYSAGSACPGNVATSTAPNSAVPCEVFSCAHGTHVAGIAAGKDAGQGYSGVARDAKLISIRVFNVENGQMVGWNSDVVAGMNRVYELRNSYTIAAVNMSLTSSAYQSGCDVFNPLAASALRNLLAAGIAPVAASGNDGYTDRIGMPACLTGAVSVGAVWDEDTGSCGGSAAAVDKVACFSNTVPELSLLAPGTDISSAIPGGAYMMASGTSMAAPHVAGAFAVLRQKFPTASVAWLLSQLRSTGKAVGDYRVPAIVTPRIDVAAALVPLTFPLRVTLSGIGLGAVQITGPAGITTCRDACTLAFASGAAISVSAQTGSGARFTGWSGACSGTGACSFTMSGEVSLTAGFDPVPISELNCQKSGDAKGYVNFSPAGQAAFCSDSCIQKYATGTTIILTAEPGASAVFTGWSGACSGTGDCTLVLTGNTTVTASFARAPASYSLRYQKTGDGSGSVRFAPAGGSATCSSSCSQSYVAGTAVTVTAEPADGAAFAGWSGACSGRDACMLSMDAAKSLTATFTPAVQPAVLSYQKAGDGNGSVVFAAAGASASCSSSCQQSYAPGTVVTLTPQPAAGSVFLYWDGACRNAPACSLTMSGPVSVAAVFARLAPMTLIYQKLGQGQGRVNFTPNTGKPNCSESCSQGFTAGTVVTLTATPLAGSTFAGWSGACTGTASCQVRLDNPATVAATFAPATVALTYENLGKGQGNVGFAPAGGPATCSRSCVQRYAAGTTVAVTAQPLAGSTFTGWSGACTGTAVCKLRLDAPAKLAATFAPSMVSLTYEKRGKGQGSVAFAPAGGSGSCSGNCVQRYGVGTIVKLTATAAKAMKFTGWGGTCTGSGACVITMGEPKSVTASFAPK